MINQETLKPFDHSLHGGISKMSMIDTNLKGQVAIVTGGSQGIGAGLTALLLGHLQIPERESVFLRKKHVQEREKEDQGGQQE